MHIFIASPFQLTFTDMEEEVASNRFWIKGDIYLIGVEVKTQNSKPTAKTIGPKIAKVFFSSSTLSMQLLVE